MFRSFSLKITCNGSSKVPDTDHCHIHSRFRIDNFSDCINKIPYIVSLPENTRISDQHQVASDLYGSNVKTGSQIVRKDKVSFFFKAFQKCSSELAEPFNSFSW